MAIVVEHQGGITNEGINGGEFHGELWRCVAEVAEAAVAAVAAEAALEAGTIFNWIKPLILWKWLFGLRGGWGCVVCVARVVKTIKQNICARLQIIVTLQLSYKMSYRHVGLAFKIRSVNR